MTITFAFSAVPVLSEQSLPNLTLQSQQPSTPPFTPSKVKTGTHFTLSPVSSLKLPSGDWACTFDIPWEKMSHSLLSSKVKNEEPSAKDRRNLICVLYGEIANICTKPGRRNLRKIAQNVVSEYPAMGDSFQDIVIGSGHASLLRQLEIKFENENRTSAGSPLRKRLRVADDENEAPVKRRKGSESYGCVNWQPGNLAVGETPESQEAKRKWMVEEYSKAQPDMPLVHTKMEETFPTLRTEINSGKDVTNIIDAWPFLKTAECIEEHFVNLCGIPKNNIVNLLTTKGLRLYRYSRTKEAKKTHKTLKVMHIKNLILKCS